MTGLENGEELVAGVEGLKERRACANSPGGVVEVLERLRSSKLRPRSLSVSLLSIAISRLLRFPRYSNAYTEMGPFTRFQVLRESTCSTSLKLVRRNVVC